MRIERTIRVLAATAVLGIAPNAGADAINPFGPVAISGLSTTCSRDANGALTVKATWSGTAPANLVFATWKVSTEGEGLKDGRRRTTIHPDLPGNARSASYVVPAGTWPDQDKMTICRVYVRWTYAVAAQSSIAATSGARITGP